MEKCIICNTEIKGWGNNANPVQNGRCCDNCNIEVVIPYRIEAMKKGLYKTSKIDPNKSINMN
jgi:hypothetical protein